LRRATRVISRSRNLAGLATSRRLHRPLFGHRGGCARAREPGATTTPPAQRIPSPFGAPARRPPSSCARRTHTRALVLAPSSDPEKPTRIQMLTPTRGTMRTTQSCRSTCARRPSGGGASERAARLARPCYGMNMTTRRGGRKTRRRRELSCLRLSVPCVRSVVWMACLVAQVPSAGAYSRSPCPIP